MKTLRFLFSLTVSMMTVTGLQAGGIGPSGALGISNATVSVGGAHVASAPAVGHMAVANHAAVVGHAPIMRTGTMVGRGIARNTTAPTFSTTAAAPARSTPVAPAMRAHNAWTDAASTANGRNRAQGSFTGTVLYPNATHDPFGNPYPSNRGRNDSSSGRVHPFRFHHRGYYNPYIYGYSGVLLGGYGPYYSGDTLGIADVNGNYAGYTAPDTVANGNTSADAVPDGLARPSPSGQLTLPMVPADDETAQPAATGPTGTGPDSLVEAVQAELSRRGYFGGKIDAVYNPATHAAIERFQKDQQLPASGRINEATLHALQLD